MKTYDFLVRESLKRNRVYSIEAESEEEAIRLLDGFQQKPRETAANKENLVVDDYDVLEIWLPE